METTNNRKSIPTISGNKISRYLYAPYKLSCAFQNIEIIARRYCDDFKLSILEKEKYGQFIKYLHGDVSFDGDLKKGIALVGPTGTGKSLMFKIMEDYRAIDNIQYEFNGRIKDLSWGSPVIPDDLNLTYASQGEDGLYSYKMQNVLYIDDLGTEVKAAKNFGNELDVVNHILFHRHRLTKLTHISSNLPKSKMKEKYGDRVGSRMHEMFNFIELNVKDKRVT